MISNCQVASQYLELNLYLLKQIGILMMKGCRKKPNIFLIVQKLDALRIVFR